MACPETDFDGNEPADEDHDDRDADLYRLEYLIFLVLFVFCLCYYGILTFV